jgi:hypothetical protein
VFARCARACGCGWDTLSDGRPAGRPHGQRALAIDLAGALRLRRLYRDRLNLEAGKQGSRGVAAISARSVPGNMPDDRRSRTPYVPFSPALSRATARRFASTKTPRRAHGDGCAADGHRDGLEMVRNTPTHRRSSVRESRLPSAKSSLESILDSCVNKFVHAT